MRYEVFTSSTCQNRWGILNAPDMETALKLAKLLWGIRYTYYFVAIVGNDDTPWDC